MAADGHEEFRYEPKQCRFLRQVVWAIVTQQPEGSRRIVNCLDKDEACFGLNCAFTTDGGEWPYNLSLAEAPCATDRCSSVHDPRRVGPTS